MQYGEVMSNIINKLLWFFGCVGIGVIAFYFWPYFMPKKLGENFADGNGRIEATEVDIATKTSGRIKEIFADEGDFVSEGQVLARMDTQQLEAQRREAEAQLQQAQYAVKTAQSQVKQKTSEQVAAVAVLAQRKAESEALRKRLDRAEVLSKKGASSLQDLDDSRARFLSGQAAISAADAQVAAAEAAVSTAQSQLLGSQTVIAAIQATIDRLQVDIDDCILKAPCDGRVQYRVSQPGEVLGNGGRILNLVNLSDVYMTFFLPTAVVGKLTLGGEVRLILDAAPQFVIPARISFVADVAQFTPKTVETASERQKLMFRVKAKIDSALLRKYIKRVKTGLPGMAYVRLAQQADWPNHLQIKLPETTEQE